MNLKRLKNLSGMQLMAVGFFLLILLGTILLSFPFASKSRTWTPLITALFTSTSASCVTGLSLVDTGSYWSVAGQLIILFLIQVGGLGFITLGASVAMLLRRKISLKQRGWLRDSFNVLDIGGILHLIRRAMIGTFLFEGVGAVILTIRFYPKMGFGKALYCGIFHSISAFCNAGFDLMAQFGESSFMGYYNDPFVSLTLCALILVGGAGFFVWSDIFDHRLHFRRYSLQSKMVLSMSVALIVFGTLLFYLLEGNRLFAGMSTPEKLLSSLFAAITPRTAGFNTTDTGALSEGSKLLTIILMFIGGASGSTAGGVKVATIFVLLLHLRSTLLRMPGTNIFGRRIDDTTVSKASALVCIYLLLTLSATLALCGMQPLSLSDAMFEVVSAVCTVGMTTGITRSLTVASQFILIFLMYLGRLGSLSFALSFTDHKKLTHIEQPVEHINIG